MNCFSLGHSMWEHARLICFILDAHRSVVPTKLLHSTSDRSTGLHNALALYRPRQKLPFYYLVRRSSQRTARLCMSVVSAILRCHPASWYRILGYGGLAESGQFLRYSHSIGPSDSATGASSSCKSQPSSICLQGDLGHRGMLCPPMHDIVVAQELAQLSCFPATKSLQTKNAGSLERGYLPIVLA